MLPQRALASVVFLFVVACEPQGATPASASSAPTLATPEEFIDGFVAAVRSRDAAVVRGLVHPECLRAVDERSESFFSQLLGREAQLSIPAQHQATMKVISADAPLPFEGPFLYPVRPTRLVQFDFDDPERGSSRSVIRPIVRDQGRWWLVVPLPTEETLREMEKRNGDAERERRRAAALARDVDEPLLGELRELLRDGRKIAAIKRYREVSGEGLAAAKAVVDLLGSEPRSTPVSDGTSRSDPGRRSR